MRKVDFGIGKRLGREDHIVTWSKPDRPDWMDEAAYAALPDGLDVRELQVRVVQRGFRTRSLIVATTLLDALEYTKAEIASLYRARWTIELSIRSLKQTLGMDILRCKTPEMVRKEIWTGLLAYNLIRRTILQSAQAAGKLPRQVSFTAALQKIAASWGTAPLSSEGVLSALINNVLKRLSKHRVGHRPDRIEPRAVKRRPKVLALLTVPRDQARAELLAGKKK